MKSVLWRVANACPYIEDARCLKVKPRERAFKRFKSPVLNVLKLNDDILKHLTVFMPAEYY